MSSNHDVLRELEARVDAHEHLLRHLITSVFARTEDPIEAFEGFQKLLAGPIRRRLAAESERDESDASLVRVLEIVDWIALGIREDLVRAQATIAGRRR